MAGSKPTWCGIMSTFAYLDGGRRIPGDTFMSRLSEQAVMSGNDVAEVVGTFKRMVQADNWHERNDAIEYLLEFDTTGGMEIVVMPDGWKL